MVMLSGYPQHQKLNQFLTYRDLSVITFDSL